MGRVLLVNCVLSRVLHLHPGFYRPRRSNKLEHSESKWLLYGTDVQQASVGGDSCCIAFATLAQFLVLYIALFSLLRA